MANKKYNFKIPFLTLEGEEAKTDGKPDILSSILANIIMKANVSDDTIKFFDWALELHKTGLLQLDDSDKDKLEKWIVANQMMTTLAKGRLIQVLKTPEK